MLEEVAATPDAGVASLGNVGGARARLLDAQESLRRQLQAQVGTVVSCMQQNALWLLRVLWEDSMNRMVSGNMRGVAGVKALHNKLIRNTEGVKVAYAWSGKLDYGILLPRK